MKYQAYLIDLDGTMYRGKEKIPTATAFIKRLRAHDIPLVFITNNATLSPKEIQQKLDKEFDIQAQESEIYTSSLAVVDYLKMHHANDSLYVIGESSLITLLEDAGLTITQDESATVVVQALDRQVTYQELSSAVHILLQGGEFIVTNDDRLIPNGNQSDPSSGAITAFLSYSSGVKPKIFGKPYSPIVEGAMSRLDIPSHALALIGDNYDTDILAGINMGLDTIMVLTGVSMEEDIQNIDKQPTYIVENLSQWDVMYEE